MKKLTLLYLLIASSLVSYSQEKKSVNIKLEYVRSYSKYNGSDSYVHANNMQLMDHLYFSSNLNDTINRRINTSLKYMYKVNLSKLLFDDYYAWMLTTIGYEDLPYVENPYKMQKTKLLGSLSDKFNHDTLLFRELISPNLGTIQKPWDKDSICIDTICCYHDYLQNTLKCGYKLIQDSILVIEFWKWGESYLDKEAVKYSFIFNLHTGYPIGFYDMFEDGHFLEIIDALGISDDRFPMSNLVNDKEYSRSDGIDMNPAFFLDDYKTMIHVYGRQSTTMYGLDIYSDEYLNITKYFTSYYIKLSQVEKILKPWVIAYIGNE